MTDVVFDEVVAATYDADSANMFEPALLDATTAFLAELARPGGRALELAIGTGRVALPLADRGIAVSGIDISEPMLARLRAKPGGDAIPVAIGDMTTTRVPGEFDLVYVVFNSITNLATQDDQVRCFQNAAAHLRPGGAFVAEIFVPQLRRLSPGERYLPFHVGRRHLGFDEYDVVAQTCTSHHYFVCDGRSQYFRSRHRYAFPAEWDLMARLAGLALEARWADWAKAPFTEESTDHISVWRKTT